jgi:glycosyltransferase involved in cell wall biosynthesis
MIDKAVLIPTYNEELAIETVIKNILNNNPDVKIFLADSSTDKTPEIAESLGATVIRTEKLGKGYSVKEAFKTIEAKKLIMIDGDNTYPNDLSKIFKLLDNYDIVFTSRLRGKIEPGAMPLLNTFTNHFTSWYARCFLGIKNTDVMSGLIGFRYPTYKNLDIKANGFELEVEIVVESFRLNLKAAEIAIEFYNRIGKPKIEYLDGFRILYHFSKRALPFLWKKSKVQELDMYDLEGNILNSKLA